MSSKLTLSVDTEVVARAKEYAERIARHIEALRDGAQRAGMSYHLLLTDQPLDSALREYLAVRQGRP